MVEESQGLGDVVGGEKPLWFGGRGVVSLRGCGGVHTLALSQATRLVMVHERAAPWRTLQSKEVVQLPKGVFVMMEMLARDSAIHSV